MIWLVVGQALNYLGITDNKVFELSGWKRDSLLAPNGNSGSYSTKIETLLVNQSFTYNGYPGKGIYTAIYYQNSNSIYEDTVYEVSDTLRRLYIIGKKTDGSPYKVDIKAIVTPFSVNNKWRLGLSGPYVGDFDGDNSANYVDTLWWYEDTMRVISQEQVTVPAGTFNAYKLYSKLRGRIWSSTIKEQAGNLGFDPYSDSLIRNYYIWWVPSLGLVKDSIYAYVQFNGPFGTRIITKSWEVSELSSYTTTIAERNNKTLFIKGVLKIEENSRIYNISGKLIFEGRGGLKLDKGIYFMKTRSSLVKVIVF
ncbi:MAG: hypothetical protein ABIL89_00430 [candidate division WOR-3 bacterium]|jgi:hypothetical protein